MRRGEPQPRLRCAIYTRVSTDHGLEQEFNSLDAQREAAEAYVKSQAHEGWTCLPAAYDDGGFSGGSLEQPALQQLLADMRARRIDVVVVYKVDRLTRSLADFAKLVELFDEHGVSFVSVTQAFNTTISMGRLTLNVLLSFAQFEREVTGERIRDKIAASKKKGIWMGGIVPLGYRVENRKLLIEDREAEQVRSVFRRYLEIGSIPALQEELRRAGVVTRARSLSSGRVIGGIPFTNGPLGHLLRNRVYLGEIKHKGESYPGEHPAIIPLELFEAVQAKLRANENGRRRWIGSEAPLKGKLYDDRGNRMTPAYGSKGGVRYRYYVSQALLQRRKAEAGSVPRVPAPELEGAIVDALRARGLLAASDSTGAVFDPVERVTIRTRTLEIAVKDESGGSPLPPIEVAWSRPSYPRRRGILSSEGGAEAARPIRPEARVKLLVGIAQGRAWLKELVSGEVTSTDAIAERQGISERSVRMTITLAFLSPDLVRAAVEGRLARGTGVTSFFDLPISWQEQ